MVRLVPATGVKDRGQSRVEVTSMLQDLATIVPPAIVCAGFLAGVWMLLRREMAPKRRSRRDGQARPGDDRTGELRKGSE